MSSLAQTLQMEKKCQNVMHELVQLNHDFNSS